MSYQLAPYVNASKLGKDGSGSEDFSVKLAAIPNESENQLSKCQS